MGREWERETIGCLLCIAYILLLASRELSFLFPAPIQLLFCYCFGYSRPSLVPFVSLQCNSDNTDTHTHMHKPEHDLVLPFIYFVTDHPCLFACFGLFSPYQLEQTVVVPTTEVKETVVAADAPVIEEAVAADVAAAVDAAVAEAKAAEEKAAAEKAEQEKDQELKEQAEAEAKAAEEKRVAEEKAAAEAEAAEEKAAAEAEAERICSRLNSSQ